MFNVGDLAVYPAHGVGRIEAIEKKSVGGEEYTFYIMRILENNMKIMIPQSNTAQVGLRQLISDEEVEKVFAILREKDVEFTPQTWNRRYREYTERIKTGSIFDLAAVLRDLFLLQEEKPLSFGERKMMDTAKNLLVKEISIAQQKDEKDVAAWIESAFTVSNAAGGLPA